MSSLKPTLATNAAPPYIPLPASGKKNVCSEKKGAAPPEISGPPPSVFVQDVVNISEKDSQTGNLAASAQEVLKELAQNYPGISITVSEDSGGRSTAEIAAEAGAGLHIIISREFMDRMSSSQEEFDTCIKILLETVTRLNSLQGKGKGAGVYLDEKKASFWQVIPENGDNQTAASQIGGQSQGLLELMQSLSGKKDGGPIKMSSGSSPSSNVASIYAKVARASSQFDVREALSKARREIMSLQMTAAMGEDKEQVKARAAIRSLNKLLVRGNQKIKKLDKEQMLAIRRQRARQREELEEAREMEQERQRMKRRRRNEDNKLVEDGRREKNHIDRSDSGYGSPVPDMPAATPPVNVQDMGSAAMTGGDFCAADVMISAEISF